MGRARSDELVPQLKPDPSVDVQVASPGGPWLLWEPQRASARREGLLCSVTACSNPECPAADVTLEISPVDTGLAYVKWDSKTVELAFAGPAPCAENRRVRCSLDVYRMTVEQEGEDAYALEIRDRLVRLLTPELLDRFHDELLGARGLARGMLRELPEGWQPGELVPWMNLWQAPRFELLERSGQYWLCMDNHCIMPGCTCADTLIDFLRYDSKSGVAKDGIGPVIVKPNGDWTIQPKKGDGAQALRELWSTLSERWHNVPKELERRRERLRTELGPLALRMSQQAPALESNTLDRDAMPPMASSLPQSGTSTSRNAPCPCGSGRKYKRCCGAE